MINVQVVCAISYPQGIFGQGNRLPWRFERPNEDMRRFMSHTKGGAVVMGRKTWESIPENFRPFTDRENIVISSDKNYQAIGATVCRSLEEAIKKSNSDKVSIIGGVDLIKEAIQKRIALRILLTRAHIDLIENEGTKFFKELLSDKWLYPFVALSREKHIQKVFGNTDATLEFFEYENCE